MADDFFAKLLNSTPRARVLRVFVFHQNNPLTLAQVARRSGVSPRQVKKEVNFFVRLRMLKKGKISILVKGGRARVRAKRQVQDAWEFNPQFKYASALSNFIHQISPIKHSTILETLRRSGRLSAVVLSGSFVGDPSRPTDLVIAGDPVSEKKLEQAVRKLEPIYGREIRYAVFTTPEFRYRLTVQDKLIRDTLDYPHLILLDKTRLL